MSEASIKHWYVAIVNPRAEKKCAESLAIQGFETYVATQKQERTWSRGRKTIVDHVVITMMVFVRATEQERLSIVARNPYVLRFLTDRSRTKNSFGRSPVAIIPDSQLDQLRYILGASDEPVTFTDRHFTGGDHVRILRGTLRGIEGIVHHTNDDGTYIYLNLNILGAVKTKIHVSDIEKITPVTP